MCATCSELTSYISTMTGYIDLTLQNFKPDLPENTGARLPNPLPVFRPDTPDLVPTLWQKDSWIQTWKADLT